MTDATSGTTPPDEPAGPSGSTGSPGASVDWASIIDDWSKFAKDVVDRYAARADQNANSLRAKSYGRDQFFDDLQWFWTNAAKDAANTVQCIRDKFPPPSRPPSAAPPASPPPPASS
jgi:hypothetical protein